MEGDEDALIAVQNHYIGFIRALSRRTIKDPDGTDRYYIDEDMLLRMENKLLWSIVTGFHILPE